MAWNNTSRTPNYVLSVDVILRYSSYDEKKLVAGTLVKPVELRYVPKHVIDDERWKWFNEQEDVFVHTSIGFIMVKRTSIRER